MTQTLKFSLCLTTTIVIGLLATLDGVYAQDAEPERAPAVVQKIEADEKKAMMTPDPDEPGDDPVKEMLAAPAGVFDPEYDDDGILTRLKIKGEREVTTALRAARGDRLAREGADRNAKAAFVKFLKEEVSVRENEREEVIIVEKDGEEQAGYKNISERVIETRAQGLLRGLIVLLDHVEGEGANRKVVIVFGWSKKLADAARTAQSEMARETNPAVRPDSGNTGRGMGTGTNTRRARNLEDY